MTNIERLKLQVAELLMERKEMPLEEFIKFVKEKYGKLTYEEALEILSIVTIDNRRVKLNPLGIHYAILSIPL